MIKLLGSPKERKLLLLLLLSILLATTNLAILFDIPVFRQFLGFIFLTFIPGYLLICLLKLDKLGLIERCVFSVGLSLSFSMFFGLLINTMYFSFGCASPLSTISLVVSFSSIIIILCIIAYRQNSEAFSFCNCEFRLNTAEKVFLLVPSILPFLSVFGMHIMKATGNNIYIMALLFIIPSYLILIVLKRHKVPERIYPSMIFLIGLSIIILLPLRSNHIIGLDAHAEYHLFEMTITNWHWHVFERSSLASCLSISLLPAIYQSTMNINSERLFIMLYPLIFAFSTLIVYEISNKYLGPFYAFFAAFFFASIQDFSITCILARSNMAILFFGMLIIALFHDDIPEPTKKLLFIVFSISIIISHYSTAYILFFIFLTTLIGLQIIKTITAPMKATGFVYKSEFINVWSVFLFFILLFVWYAQVTDVAFIHGVRFVEKSFISLHDLFVLEARSSLVMQAFGQDDTIRSSFVVKIIFIMHWITIALIAIGILDTLLKFSSKVSGLSGYSTSDDSPKKIDYELFIISLVLSFMMVISLIIPNISVGYSMSRQYILAATIFSTFIVLGSFVIGKYIKIKPYWLLTAVLVLYFLSTSGVLHQITGTPSSLVLNSEGRAYNMYYINDEDSYAAKWLGNHREKTRMIYGDRVIRRWLLSQASIPGSDVDGSGGSVTLLERDKIIDGYIFLRSHNVRGGKLMDIYFQDFDITEYEYRFAKKAKCYSNNGAEVWL